MNGNLPFRHINCSLHDESIGLNLVEVFRKFQFRISVCILTKKCFLCKYLLGTLSLLRLGLRSVEDKGDNKLQGKRQVIERKEFTSSKVLSQGFNFFYTGFLLQHFENTFG